MALSHQLPPRAGTWGKKETPTHCRSRGKHQGLQPASDVMLPWEVQAQAMLQPQKIAEYVLEASPAQIMKKHPSGAAKSPGPWCMAGQLPWEEVAFPCSEGCQQRRLIAAWVFLAASAVMDEAKTCTKAGCSYVVITF